MAGAVHHAHILPALAVLTQRGHIYEPDKAGYLAMQRAGPTLRSILKQRRSHSHHAVCIAPYNAMWHALTRYAALCFTDCTLCAMTINQTSTLQAQAVHQRGGGVGPAGCISSELDACQAAGAPGPANQ